MPTNLADAVRYALIDVVFQRSQMRASVDSIRETTLIRNGAYCGRRFALMGYSLIWFLEEGQIKFYTPSGQLEMSCSVQVFCDSLSSTQDQLRKAA